MPIQLQIICHESMCCYTLENLFDGEKDFQFMGCFSGLDGAIHNATQYYCGLIMICSHFLTNEGAECIPRIRRALNRSRLVIFNSSFSGAQELLMVQEGVVGIFDDAMSPQTFPNALRKISSGECWLRRGLITKLVGGKQVQPAKDCMVPLTQREKEVYSLIVSGYMNKEIASRLFVSEATVKTHINNMFRKLGLKSRNEAILYAVKCNHTLLKT